MFSSRSPEDLTPNRLTGALNVARARGQRILDLTESNPTRAGLEYPQDLLRPLGDCRGLAYAPEPFGLLGARTAIVDDYARRGVRVAPERVALVSSTSEAYACLFKLLTDAGDEILVPNPSYPLFDHLAKFDHVTVRPYALDVDAAWRIDFESVRSAITPRTKAILFVSPNNPTGSFVTADEVEQLAEIAAAHELALIADEVFADYELAPGSRQAAGCVLRRTDVLAFSLGGLSKSVGLPQVKLAWMAAAGPDRLIGPALERLEIICDTYLSVSTPVQLAAAELLERGAMVRDQIAHRISANDRRLREQAASVPACRVLASQGGWSAILNVPTFEPEEDLVVNLLQNEGVLTHPGYFFDFPRESYLVVSLLVPEAQFAEGTDRVLSRFGADGRRP
jgi:alanine-synthesizing transaminase